MPVALAGEAQLDAVVHQALAVQALAEPDGAQQVDRALFQHAGADARARRSRGSASPRTRVDARRAQQGASSSPAGPAPMIATCVRTLVLSLVFQVSDSLWSLPSRSAKTCWATAKAELAAGTPQ